jgi:hypothetical protein
MKQKNKEKKMTEKTLTVSELIKVLSRFDPNLPVEMSMNLEYQCPVTEDMIEVFEWPEENRKYLSITDTPGY